MEVCTPAHRFLALTRCHPLSLGGEKFYVTGGVKFGQDEISALDRNSKVAVALVWDGGILTTNQELGQLLGEKIMDISFGNLIQGI